MRLQMQIIGNAEQSVLTSCFVTLFLDVILLPLPRPLPDALMRRLAAEWAEGRVGDRPEPFAADAGQSGIGQSSQAGVDCASLTVVERREALPLRRRGARPRAGLANLLGRRAKRTLVRSAKGLASPWRLPALHFPSGTGKRDTAYPAPFKQQGWRSLAQQSPSIGGNSPLSGRRWLRASTAFFGAMTWMAGSSPATNERVPWYLTLLSTAPRL
jgi:hypothetical protein